MIYICPDERQAWESVFVGLSGALLRQRGSAQTAVADCRYEQDRKEMSLNNEANSEKV
ncbi:MAG: hypothetical protein NTX52_11280 [Planctomycetota bacterium]|nr:hypothetical protein [Planctomycetota bacterium]